MSGGVLLAVAGIWVLAQVLGGNALGRLGISGEATQPGTTKTTGQTLADAGKAAAGAIRSMPAPVN